LFIFKALLPAWPRVVQHAVNTIVAALIDVL